ncbi:cytochrome c oxidase subunit 2 [Sphingomonas gellani]|uniref:cytochrome-c oxidase n=1 Tax=Sphingomonas gellani TaxID=1166340 RepID=A0A1H7ZID2_9SPHN|nr:cytochrome c oxidase subunit II [Sphingomonas gellani]SEM57187.1 cytochrome c oxidase subunit 2 [Sphingomonas gellani]
MRPVEASTYAPRVDSIFWMLTAASGAVILLVGTLVLFFSIKYRRGTATPRGPVPDRLSREVEIGWTAATAFAFLFFFWFAAVAETTQFEIPRKAMEIHVVAKQWMWKLEHPNGTREINTLHVPVGVPVRLVMTSQDVIHSFFVPAFRTKQDVLPGRYVEAWFEASKPGTYHLFCTEYCGTDHSRMGGGIVVQSQSDFARWIDAQPQGDSLADQGAVLFRRMGCTGCHGGSSRIRAPSLAGVFGRQQPLEGGGFVTADESYLRDSILLPNKQVVAGYQPVMPSYQGVASEDDLIRLIAYLKSQKVVSPRPEVGP